MPDPDVVAVVSVPPGPRDDAVSGGLDWRAAGRGEIDASVQGRIAKDGMLAHSEPRRNARAIDGCHPQEAPSTLANAVIPGRERLPGRLKSKEEPCPEEGVDRHEQSFARAYGVALFIENAL